MGQKVNAAVFRRNFLKGNIFLSANNNVDFVGLYDFILFCKSREFETRFQESGLSSKFNGFSILESKYSVGFRKDRSWFSLWCVDPVFDYSLRLSQDINLNTYLKHALQSVMMFEVSKLYAQKKDCLL